jgi:hypothetical protein
MFRSLLAICGNTQKKKIHRKATKRTLILIFREACFSHPYEIEQFMQTRPIKTNNVVRFSGNRSLRNIVAASLGPGQTTCPLDRQLIRSGPNDATIMFWSEWFVDFYMTLFISIGHVSITRPMPFGWLEHVSRRTDVSVLFYVSVTSIDQNRDFGEQPESLARII